MATTTTTEFAPSQLSYQEDTSPFSFRLSPLRLLLFDLRLILARLPYAFGVLSPVLTRDPMGELYLGRAGNVITMLLNVVLFFLTLVGIGGVVVLFASLVPTAGIVVYVVLAVAVGLPGLSFSPSWDEADYYCVTAILYLNWGQEIVPSTLSSDEFPEEKWFFINGIMVGDYWLESAIDKLSMLFKRKVYGIRNRT
jgi:hypothetical protein